MNDRQEWSGVQKSFCWIKNKIRKLFYCRSDEISTVWLIWKLTGNNISTFWILQYKCLIRLYIILKICAKLFISLRTLSKFDIPEMQIQLFWSFHVKFGYVLHQLKNLLNSSKWTKKGRGWLEARAKLSWLHYLVSRSNE